MNRRMANLVCYVMCMLCLFAGTAQGLALIWLGFDNTVVWRGLASTGAVFLTCLLVVALNAVFATVPMPDDLPPRRRYVDDEDDRPLRRARSYEW